LARIDPVDASRDGDWTRPGDNSFDLLVLLKAIASLQWASHTDTLSRESDRYGIAFAVLAWIEPKRDSENLMLDALHQCSYSTRRLGGGLLGRKGNRPIQPSHASSSCSAPHDRGAVLRDSSTNRVARLLTVLPGVARDVTIIY